MAGTVEGGRKAREKNLAKDPNFYKRLGSMGGKAGAGEAYRKGGEKAAGFAANPELARVHGAKGGRVSRRGKSSEKAN